MKPVQESDKSLDPSIFAIVSDAAFLLIIQVRMSSSGDVSVFQWNRE